MIPILVAVLLLGLVCFALYSTWFVRQATGAFPCCRVVLASSDEAGFTRAKVTLLGSQRTLWLTRIVHTPPEGSTLPVPTGFERRSDPELGEKDVAWIPQSRVALRPGKSVDFEFPHAPGLATVVRVSGWLEARVGLGGTGTFFHVLVGPTSDQEREYFNANSRIRAESVVRGVRPADHPEWSELKRLEAAINPPDFRNSQSL